MSLADISRTPLVVAAQNTFGSRLSTVLDDENSLAVLDSVYRNTQGFGAMDLYEFASLIFPTPMRSPNFMQQQVI